MSSRVPDQPTQTLRGAREEINNVPPLIRLRVWYFSKEGRDLRFTRSLAESLSKVHLVGWSIKASESRSPWRNRRDAFVPAEIDFKYEPVFRGSSSTAPEETVPLFFHETLSPIIRDLFNEVGKQPQYLSMFPLGKTIDRNTIIKYTHYQLLHSLAVDPDVVNGIIHQISLADEYTRKLAYKRIGELPLKFVQGHSLLDEWLAVGTWLAKEAIRTGVVRPRSKSQAQESYDKFYVAFKCYKELETALELDFSKYTDLDAMGNQDLYLSITQMAIAFQIVPIYRKERDMYFNRFFRTTGRTICLRSLLVSFIAFVFLWFKHGQYSYRGWDWVMDREAWWSRSRNYKVAWTCSIPMLFFWLLVELTIFAEYGILKLFNKSTDERINDLRVTQGALVAKFCVRVLKMPPELMTAAERKEILHGLGVSFHDETPETQRRSLEVFLAKLG